MLFVSPRRPTRKTGEGGPRSTENGAEFGWPRLAISTALAIAGSGDVSTMEPPTAGVKSNAIRVQSGSALAWAIAVRSEQVGPGQVPGASVVVRTVMTDVQV